MAISPQNLPLEFVQSILKPRYRMKVCVECGAPAEYFYGHTHALDVREGVPTPILVISGHCSKHLHPAYPMGRSEKYIEARLIIDQDVVALTECEHKNAGCSGSWFEPMGLEKLQY